MTALFMNHVKPGNVDAGARVIKNISIYVLTSCLSLHSSCLMMFGCLMNLIAMLHYNPSWSCKTPRPIVNIKRWCILQSMVVTLLRCYPSFLLGASVWFSEAPEAQYPTRCTTGGGERVSVCICFLHVFEWMFAFMWCVCLAYLECMGITVSVCAWIKNK